MTLRQVLMSTVLMLVMLVSPARAWQAQNYVDLELILAVDVSRSMNSWRLAMQREGYVAAFRDPEVLRAIQSGPQGRIAVTYVEWSGKRMQNVLIPWRTIATRQDAMAFADQLVDQATTRSRRTSISAMLLKAAEMFERSGVRGLRKVIDVSGDGPNNSGPSLVAARNALLQRGIVINGLPILAEPADLPGYLELENLDLYYRDCVIGGPGSFLIPVSSMQNFAKAVRKKLILEIAGGGQPNRGFFQKAQYKPSPFRPASSSEAGTNCNAGRRDYQAPKISPPGSK